MRDAFGVERVSKIAMRPVYHGTTPEGMTKLRRLISSKDPAKSSFKFVTGKPRTDGSPGNPNDPRPEGLYTTRSRTDAEWYSLTGRSPDHGGMERRRASGRVGVFNTVGVKPKFKVENEEIYDPRKLGAPLKVHHTKRGQLVGKPAKRDADIADKKHDELVETLRRVRKPDPEAVKRSTEAAVSSKYPLYSYQTEDAMRAASGSGSFGLPTTAEVRAAGRKKIFGNQPKPRKRREPPPGFKPEFV